MKTLLFAPMHLNNVGRLERHIKWLNYTLPLKDKIGFDEVLFIDNASSSDNLTIIETQFPQVKIIKKTKFLDRISEHAYGYSYRAMANGIKYAIENGFDKIVHIDTDCFLLNNKICDYVRNVNSGFISFWCDRWKFPESTFFVLGKDQFQPAFQFFSEDFLEYYPYDLAEKRIPWTHVEKSFKGDRYGEINLAQDSSMDYYCQAPNQIEFKFHD